MNCKVHTATKTTFFLNKESDKIDYSNSDTTFYTFNPNGNIIEYLSIGKFNWYNRIKYHFDSLNRKTQVLNINKEGDTSSITKITYTTNSSTLISNDSQIINIFDQNGNEVSRKFYFGDKLSSYWIKTYSNNNVIDLKYYYQDSLGFHEKYFYDENNQLSSIKAIIPPMFSANLYDFQGNLILRYNSSENINIEFNLDSLTISETSKYKNGMIYSKFFRYDSLGNLIESKSISNNKVSRQLITYQYDLYGNILEEFYYRENKLTMHVKYKYQYYK